MPGSRRRFLGGVAVAASSRYASPVLLQDATLKILIASDDSREAWHADPMTQWYEAQTGVRIEWDILLRDGAYQQRDLRLMTGDYPDIIMGINPNLSELSLYGGVEMFIDVQDRVDRLGPNLVRAFQENPLARPSLTSPDGRLYALPSIAYCRHCSMPNKIWIYEPWLRDLGLTVPETTDDLLTVLRAFRDLDLGGPSPVPLAVYSSSPADAFERVLSNAFTFNPGGERLYLQDGRVTPAYAQPAWKDGLKFLKQLVDESLVTEAMLFEEPDLIFAMANAPDQVQLGAFLAPSPTNLVLAVDDGTPRWMHYAAVPALQGPGGTRLTFHNPYQPYTAGQFVITDHCKDPDLAVRWCDGLYAPEASLRIQHGPLGTGWDWAASGTTGIDGKPAVWQRLDGATGSLWQGVAPTYLPASLTLGWAKEDAPDWSLESTLYAVTERDYAPYAQPDEWVMPPLAFNQDQISEFVNEKTDIGVRIQEVIMRTMMGDFDIDAEWEGYLGDLDDKGLATLLKVYQEVIDAR